MNRERKAMFRAWGAMGPRLRKRTRTLTTEQAKALAQRRWSKVKPIVTDAAGCTLVAAAIWLVLSL
jgi:hypothetical protein